MDSDTSINSIDMKIGDIGEKNIEISEIIDVSESI